MRKLLFASALIISLSTQMSAQSFTCDGTFYISLNQSGPPTTFFELTTTGGINFQPLFDVNFHMNAIGISTVDNNIYAVTFDSNDVFRVEADGTTTSVFAEPDVGASWNAAAGAVNNNGVYAVHDRNLDMIFLYQTGSTVTKLGSVALFWDPSTGNTGLFDHNIDDLVFDPFDDTVMYTYQRFWDASGPTPTQGHLLKVNVDMTSPDFGMVSSVGQLDPAQIVHLGSLFFDTNGALHGYGANTTGPITQERLVKINQNNADIELLGIGPQASGVDGCSCRNPMKLTKTAEIIETTCDSNYIKFRIEIENFSTLVSTPLKLKDTLGFDGVIQSFDFGSFDGTTLTGGGVGTDNFIFEDFTLEGTEKLGFEFVVATSLSNTLVSNQARLYENIDFNPIDSDDPSTMEISDPTSIFLPDLLTSTEEAIEALLCDDESIEINGMSYSEAGTYVDTLTNSTGCDSILLITIATGFTTEEIINESLCPGESIEINGVVYSEAGSYMQTLTNNSDCDSLLFIEIIQDDFSTGEISASFCEGGSVEVNGVIYDVPGSYMDTIVNTPGCDSILFITIIEDENTIRNEDVSLCPGENIVINGITYDTPGFFTQELTNENGCDSTINITVMIDTSCDDCIPSETQNKNFLRIDKSSSGLATLRFSVNGIESFYASMNEEQLTDKLMLFIQESRPDFTIDDQITKCHMILHSFEELPNGKSMTSR